MNQKDDYITNFNQIEFAFFCIENLALHMGADGKRVYEALARESDILQTYIVPNYESLHTQGKDYIVEDILEVMKERGVVV